MFIGQFGQAQPVDPQPEPSPEDFKDRLKRTGHIIPDLQTQYEALLDCVWENEQEQDFQRRIDNAAMLEELRAERLKKKGGKPT